MSTVWNHACFVRLGVRVTDFKPRLTTADVAPPVRGMESFSEDAGFDGLGYDVVPFGCTVVMNNYMMADTAKITLPYDKLSPVWRRSSWCSRSRLVGRRPTTSACR